MNKADKADPDPDPLSTKAAVLAAITPSVSSKEPEIVIGSMVVRKSHPDVPMTVCFLDTEVGSAVCYWLDESREPMTEAFPLVLLRPQSRRHPLMPGHDSRASTTERRKALQIALQRKRGHAQSS
jgi:hypothetical protein